MKNHMRFAAVLAASLLAPHALAQCADTELLKLTDPDGDNPFDAFGGAVALSADTMLIGESGQNRLQVFREANSIWTREALINGSGHNVEFLGVSAALDGDLALIGAAVDSDFCNDPNDCATGAALIYRRINNTWTPSTKLQRPFYLDSFNSFGQAVALQGDTALVGASQSINGVVVPWQYNGQIWIRLDPLEADDGQEGDSFGAAIAIDNDIIVIGARGDDDDGPQSGSAYIFRNVGGQWQQETKLTPNDLGSSHRFGSAVAILGDMVVIGAPGGGNSGGGTGAVYTYRHNGSSWILEHKLVPAGALTGDAFGQKVSIDEPDILLATALGDDHAGNSAGAAYVYTLDNATWTEAAKLTASDANANQFFGIATATAGGRAAIGASELFNGGGGAVYFYDDLGQCPCPADFNNDGQVNTQDVLAFLNAWSNGDPEGDFNNDGDINTLDVLAFLTAWSAGC